MDASCLLVGQGPQGFACPRPRLAGLNSWSPVCLVVGAGAYRLKDVCKGCPNTAWLLFLMFSLAIVCLVALAVYLSKRKINLAGLSIGVVCGWVSRVCLLLPGGVPAGL